MNSNSKSSQQSNMNPTKYHFKLTPGPMYVSNLLRVVSDLHDGVVDIVGFGPLAENLGGAPLRYFGTHVELIIKDK